MSSTHHARGILKSGTATATCSCGWTRTETGVGTGAAAFMAQQHEQAMAAGATWCTFPDCIHHPKAAPVVKPSRKRTVKAGA